MHAVGAWDDGKGNIAVQEGRASLTSSDAATPYPNQGPPKKKMTFAEYKNKDKSRFTVAEVRARATEPEQVAKAVEKRAEQATALPDPTKSQASEQHGTKRYTILAVTLYKLCHRLTFTRSADTMTAANEPQTLEARPVLPPAKKAQTTPEPNSAAPKDQPKTLPKVIDPAVCYAKTEPYNVLSHKINHEGDPAQKEAQTLKVKLKLPTMEKTSQPGLPPMLSPHLSLPPMLSPLSSNIEDKLAKRTPSPSIRGDTSSAEKSKASRISLNGTPSSKEKASASKVLQKTAGKNVSTPTKEPQELKGVTSAPRQVSKDLALEKVVPAKPTSNGVAKVSSPVVKATVPDASRKLRLRYTIPVKKKSNRRILSQYLRMKPTAGKYPSWMQETREEVPRSEVDQIVDKVNQTRNESEASQGGEKRRRLHDNEDGDTTKPPTKRQKAPGGLPQKTHTPKQSSISSPALSHLSSAQKAHLATTDIGLTSTPMVRAGSGGSSVHTPHQLAMNGTPTAPDTGNSRIPLNMSSATKPNLDELRAESKRLSRTGVDLKHEADVFFKKLTPMSNVERKQGVILGIESVLCFMLSFSVTESITHVGDRTSWESILPFLYKVNYEAKGLRHLAGLAFQIESVIRDILVHIDTHRLARNPLDDFSNISKIKDPAKSAEHNKAAEFALQFRELRQNADRALGALRESWTCLNLEEISTKFPETWVKREDRPPFGKGWEAITLGDYKRTFTLPLSSATSKLEAISYGNSLLAELCKNDGVGFTPKLIL